MFKLDLEKAEEPEIKLPTSTESLKKQEGSRRTPTPALHQSLWLCGSQQTVENSERDGNTRPPDLPPEKSVRMSRSKLEPDMEQRNGMEWFKIDKGVPQGCILLLCLFNLYAEYIMQNARLDES